MSIQFQNFKRTGKSHFLGRKSKVQMQDFKTFFTQQLNTIQKSRESKRISFQRTDKKNSIQKTKNSQFLTKKSLLNKTQFRIKDLSTTQDKKIFNSAIDNCDHYSSNQKFQNRILQKFKMKVKLSNFLKKSNFCSTDTKFQQLRSASYCKDKISKFNKSTHYSQKENLEYLFQNRISKDELINKKSQIKDKNKINIKVLNNIMQKQKQKFLTKTLVSKQEKNFQIQLSQKLYENLFIYKLKLNDKKTVESLLNKCSLLANIQLANKDYPLHIAIRRNFEEIVKLLLIHKANSNSKNDKNEKPLDLAIKNSNQKIIKYLLYCGANPFKIQQQTDNAQITKILEDFQKIWHKINRKECIEELVQEKYVNTYLDFLKI